MWLARLEVVDFRNYESARLDFPPGLTVIRGDNGAGKTNLLEAVAYLGSFESFRSAPGEALVRHGRERAVVRASGERSGRPVLVEAEVTHRGRGRVAVNRQTLRRTSEVRDCWVSTVFTPDDLELVKGGPAGRRRYLDDVLVALHPRHGALRREVDRVLRQRNALLRDAGGRLSPTVRDTLDVWDSKLAAAGESLGDARADLVARLATPLAESYQRLAGATPPVPVAAVYEAPWREPGLAAALAAARQEEVRRGTCLVGPHRDEVSLGVGGMPARTHASQGEQRSLALALRLAAHQVVTDTIGEVPLLLLDDVFSELDQRHCRALLDLLPAGQALLTTTGSLPGSAAPDLVVTVEAGTVAPPTSGLRAG